MQLRLYVIRTVAAAMERVDRACAAGTPAGTSAGSGEYAGVMLFVLKLLVANTDDLACTAARPASGALGRRESLGAAAAAAAAATASAANTDRKLDRILAVEENILRAIQAAGLVRDSESKSLSTAKKIRPSSQAMAAEGSVETRQRSLLSETGMEPKTRGRRGNSGGPAQVEGAEKRRELLRDRSATRMPRSGSCEASDAGFCASVSAASAAATTTAEQLQDSVGYVPDNAEPITVPDEGQGGQSEFPSVITSKSAVTSESMARFSFGSPGRNKGRQSPAPEEHWSAAGPECKYRERVRRPTRPISASGEGGTARKGRTSSADGSGWATATVTMTTQHATGKDRVNPYSRSNVSAHPQELAQIRVRDDWWLLQPVSARLEQVGTKEGVVSPLRRGRAEYVARGTWHRRFGEGNLKGEVGSGFVTNILHSNCDNISTENSCVKIESSRHEGGDNAVTMCNQRNYRFTAGGSSFDYVADGRQVNLKKEGERRGK